MRSFDLHRGKRVDGIQSTNKKEDAEAKNSHADDAEEGKQGDDGNNSGTDKAQRTQVKEGPQQRAAVDTTLWKH